MRRGFSGLANSGPEQSSTARIVVAMLEADIQVLLMGFGAIQKNYGARNLRISFSSSSVSVARTRICRTTARASRGEMFSGALWQRPQCVRNNFSPCAASSVALTLVFVGDVVCGFVCFS